MRAIKCLVFILFSFLFVTCIDRYYPEEIELLEPKLVVDGMISNNHAIQSIKLSRSVPTDSVWYVPYSGCNVSVIDDSGNEFIFSESDTTAGEYQSRIEPHFLVPGNRFKLVITTPQGRIYESDEEEMLPVSPVDTLRYKLESKINQNDNFPEDGLQFYLNLDAPENHSRYYMWSVEETYEYHSTWPIKEFFYNGKIHLVPVDYSVFTCYKTEKREDIFVLTTDGFTKNAYEDLKLHFVNDHTQKLMFNYSVLVHQYAISEKAYEFWKYLKENNQEDANLFNKQPMIVESNIHNVEDEKELVLGYFGVFSSASKRIVVGDVEGLTFSQVSYCTPIKIEMGFPFEPRPLHLIRYEDEEGPALGWALPECIDCRLKGGTVVKPPFFE